MNYPTLIDWLWIEHACHEGMINSITNNFREVLLSFNGKQWELHFVLEKHCDDDLEEIEEIVGYTADNITNNFDKISKVANVKVIPIIRVTQDDLLTTSDEQRILYRRKE